jgi:hypothetical protein
MSVTLNCTNAPLVQCGKKMKLSYDGGDSGGKKCKRFYDGAYGAVWRTMESGSLFCVGASGRNLASVGVEMFSHLIYFLKKCDKFCIFNAICKDNTAINCSSVQHNSGSFPSTLTGHTTLVNL